jgi:NodT family efflux transporter outer membrane factor (OMF) lipoprotein
LPACLVAAAFVLSACGAPAGEVAGPAELPDAFSASGGAVAPERWWTAFGDPRLNELTHRALAGNFTLRGAWDRLAQARAVADRTAAPLLPSVEGSAGVARTAREVSGLPRTDETTFSLGAAAAFEVDLWGRVRSTYDAARLDAAATEEELHAAAITLAARVAATWYQLVEQRGQADLLAEQLETNEKYLEIITLRYRQGKAGATDVLQQRQLVESTRGELALVDSAIAVLRHEMAVLLGRPPGTFDAPAAAELPKLPPLPSTGLPAELVRRRPDVRAAEIRVRAADRLAAAAVADQFPRLSLTASAEASAEQVADIFDNWLANLAANLVAPLFDAGRRRAEVERTRAVLSERLHRYGQTVLESFQDVEDALAREDEQARYVASLGRQLELARQAAEQNLDNYTKGTTDFTRYLTSLLTYQNLQRSSLRARRQLVGFRIDLYRALAGRWELPGPSPARLIRQPSGASGPAERGEGDVRATTEPAP